MGENLDEPGRLAVRTPMQWSDARHGGFSDARADRLPGRPPSGGYSPEHVNVSHQRRDPDSLLNTIQLFVRRYRECPELGWAPVHVLDQPHDAVLALCSEVDDAAVVTLHNLGPDPLVVPVDLGAERGPGRVLVDLLADGDLELDDRGRAEVHLDGYGYRWLRVVGPQTRRLV